MASGNPLKLEHQRIVNKFFIALVLYDLCQMKTPFEVASSFHIDRGLVQNLMGLASMNSSLIQKFCTEIDELWCYKELLLDLTHRLTYCCNPDLLQLMQLPCVKLVCQKIKIKIEIIPTLLSKSLTITSNIFLGQSKAII